MLILLKRLLFWTKKIQGKTYEFNQFMEKIKKDIKFIFGVTLFFSTILVVIKLYILAGICLTISTLFVFLSVDCKWDKSVLHFLLVTIFYNLVYIFTVFLFIFDILFSQRATISWKVIFISGLVIYAIVWICFSLFADEKVAILANEIVATVSTILFTVGTYIFSQNIYKFPNYKKLAHQFIWGGKEKILLIEKIEFFKMISSLLMFILEMLFYLCLPYISISLFCGLIIHIRKYLLEKEE